MPDAPGFVIVNVPPARSSGVELSGAGARRDVADRGGERAEAQTVGIVDDRHDEALEVEVDRDAEVDGAVHRDDATPSVSLVVAFSAGTRAARR